MSACDLSVKHLNELIPIQAVKMKKKEEKNFERFASFSCENLEEEGSYRTDIFHHSNFKSKETASNE